MPRTLFNSHNPDLFDDNQLSIASHYEWLPEVEIIPVDDWYVLVNPDNGGWAACKKSEWKSIKTEEPKNRTGEFFCQIGLCSRDDDSKKVKQKSPFTEELYFFEFAVTDSCNMACSYCFYDPRPLSQQKKATGEIARLFVDRIAEHRAKTRSTVPYVIEFTGGEPLLNFEAIRHTIEYAKHQYGNLLNAEFVIQTNLTILTSNMIEFFKEYSVGIGTSCDGPKAFHDLQRPFGNGRGTHHIVEANIKRLLKLHPTNTGSVITVITRNNVNKMPEISLYLYRLGNKEIALRYKQEIGRGRSQNSDSPSPQAYIGGLFDVLNSVITPLFNLTGVLCQERFLSLTFQHLLSSYRPFMCERSPCGAARNICAVQQNGDVYGCNSMPGNSDLFLGNIRESSFEELLKTKAASMLHQRTVARISECASCTFRGWCGSPCPDAAFTKYGTIMAKSAECEIYKARYFRALRGLLRDEFDLTVIGKLADFDNPIAWIEW